MDRLAASHSNDAAAESIASKLVRIPTNGLFVEGLTLFVI